jgi:L-threonylcarbamoyladenylate synthase
MAAIIAYSAATLDSLSHQVTSVIRRGGVVAIPTETYYGLGVDPFDEKAVARLLSVKEREPGKPILVLIGSLDQLESCVTEVPPAASVLIEAFWPGPLTLVFPVRPALPTNLSAGTGMVGMRLSSCRPLTDLLQRIGPLTGTSANRTGHPPARTAEAVQEHLHHAVDLIVDAGPTPGGLPSTVVEVQTTLRIIRAGAIAPAALDAALRKRGFFLNVS